MNTGIKKSKSSTITGSLLSLASLFIVIGVIFNREYPLLIFSLTEGLLAFAILKRINKLLLYFSIISVLGFIFVLISEPDSSLLAVILFVPIILLSVLFYPLIDFRFKKYIKFVKYFSFISFLISIPLLLSINYFTLTVIAYFTCGLYLRKEAKYEILLDDDKFKNYCVEDSTTTYESIEKLKKVKALFDDGVINEKQFESLKGEILNN